MSVSGISSFTAGAVPHRATDASRKLDVSTNADGSKSLEVSASGAGGSTVSATATKDADGNESLQITRTLANGATTTRQLSINADGTFSGQASATGKDGGTLESTSSGTYGDHALTYSRNSKYSTAAGASGERTISGDLAKGSVHRSVDGSGTNTSGTPFTRSSSVTIDSHSITAALKLTLGAIGGDGSSTQSGGDQPVDGSTAS